MEETARDLSDRRVVARCGLDIVFSADGVPVECPHAEAYYGHVIRCDSVWECPFCALRTMEERRREIVAIVAAHRKGNHAVSMLTLTVQHNRGQRLHELVRQVAKAWQRVQTGRGWIEWKKKLHISGYIRALEVTYGTENGWHPHLHTLIFQEQLSSEGDVEAFEDWVYERWTAELRKVGLREMPSREHGVSFVPCHKDDYVAKLGLASELVYAWTKEGRIGHRTMWQVLRDMTTGKGDLIADMKVWQEFARAMKGRKQLTWSKGLRERYALAIAEAFESSQLELDGMAEKRKPVVTIPREHWDRYVKDNPRVRLAILAAAEDLDRDSAREEIRRLIAEEMDRDPDVIEDRARYAARQALQPEPRTSVGARSAARDQDPPELLTGFRSDAGVGGGRGMRAFGD